MIVWEKTFKKKAAWSLFLNLIQIRDPKPKIKNPNPDEDPKQNKCKYMRVPNTVWVT